MKKEIDHSNTDEAVCPHCGHELSDSWELSDNAEIMCPECEGEFEVERIVHCTYSTSKKKVAK